MRKLLLIMITMMISLCGTSPSTQCGDNAVTALLQSDTPIDEKDVTVADGFLPVQGIVRDDIEIYPAINDGESTMVIERDDTDHITKIIRYEAK